MIRSILLAIVSGELLAIAFSSHNLGLLAWIALVPVFFSLENRSRLQAGTLFFITGIVFWAGTIYWLAHVTLPGTMAMIVWMALYCGLFGLLIRPFTINSTPYALVYIPAVWVLIEYIRSRLLTGFPWALIGYSQYLNLPAIQIADLTGAWGVSFLIVFTNAAIVEIIGAHKIKNFQRLKLVSVFLVLFLTLVFSYGFYRVHAARTAHGARRIRISVIQGNIPQEFKWDPVYNDFILDRFLNLSTQALADDPDLIVWPEAALPVVLEEEPQYTQKIKEFSAQSRALILTGALTNRDSTYYNSAVLIHGFDKLQRYDKLHLVPFGEYIPLKKTFPFLEAVAPIGDIARGREYSVFNYRTPGLKQPLKFSVLICFEDLFPEISRRFVQRGAGFLVNITNDAWYRMTFAPYQHLQASVFRAVENRVYLVRSANTGISAFIAPDGAVISRVQDASGKDIFVRGWLTLEVDVTEAGKTIYNRFGDWFVLFCGLIFILPLIRLKSAR